MVEYGQQFESEKQSLARLLKAAQDEIAGLIKERHHIDQKILKLQGDIGHLLALCGQIAPNPVSELGLTDAIRYVLATARIPMNFTDIRDALVAASFDVSQYTNILAAIHTVVTRLLKYGEITKARNIASGGHGELYFSWAKGSVPVQIFNPVVRDHRAK